MSENKIKFVKYNRPNIHSIGDLAGKELHHLRPGWNEFPAHILEMHKDDKEIQKMIKDKVIEIHDDMVKSAPKAKAKPIVDDEGVSLKNMAEADAIKIVSETHNRTLLQRWSDEETRHKVKRAIEKQLKPLRKEGSEE